MARRPSSSRSSSVAWNDFLHFFWGGTRSRETQDTRALYERTLSRYRTAPYQPEGLNDFVADLVLEACDRADRIPISPLTEALCELVDGLVTFDYLLFGFPENENIDALTTDEAVELRTYLVRKERFLLDHGRQLNIWREKVIRIIEGLLGYLPATAFRESWEDEEPEQQSSSASVPLVDLLEEPKEAIERLILTFFDEDVTQADLFASLRTQFDRRAFVASGIEWEERHGTKRKLVLPSAFAERQPARVAEMYLQGTPWERFFLIPLPFSIPFPARFEHTHILGGSGHGKTQLLQLGIARDLAEQGANRRAVVVIDSQGDLIQTISRLALLSPESEGALGDRVMLIDPNDVEYPAALNMFDADRERLGTMPLLERERVLNATVDLYEYFFGALLGAELTAKQGIIFKYLARLLLEIPDATIHTFRQLMEDGEPFRPCMEKLPPTARAFFEERFFDRSFGETKKQVLTRLWGVLSNPTFDRMFSHPRSKIDMFSALQDGKVILINTAKDLLKDEGAAILGRFFIALISQAALRRASVPVHERRPAFVYVDEAADYFDDRIGYLLNQARKYKVGMVLAHQNLDQLSPSLRASVFASTSIKYAGGVSGKDATTLASEMHSDAAFLQSQRKRRDTTSFACYVRNVTTQPLGIAIPLGVVENLPKMDEAAYEALRGRSRAAYCVPIDEVPVPRSPERRPERRAAAPPKPVAPDRRTDREAAPVESAPEPIAPLPQAESHSPAQSVTPRARRKQTVDVEPAPLGRGGREHRYLQSLIKEFAVSKGFHAVIEQPILDGAGRVDVSLAREAMKVACEISVTTGRDYELGNIEKCLAAGYTHVLFVSSDARHLKAMAKLAKSNVEEADLVKVRFHSPEEALAFLDSLVGAPEESTVRGYKVKVTRSVVSQDEAERRQKAVAGVIARNLRTRGGDAS